MQLLTVNYLPDGDDWTVTVVGDAGRRSARATGLIAARDQADQLVAQIAPRGDGRTVVHMLDGDAFAFTNTYLHARLGLAEEKPVPPAVEPAVAAAATAVAEPVAAVVAEPVADSSGDQ